MRVQTVALGERSYDVVVSGSLEGLGTALRARGGERVVVVTNPVVAAVALDACLTELRAAGVACEVVLVPDGEEHKTLTTWRRLVESLVQLRVDRSTVVLGLGGGVTGDLAGFAAATALRGLPFALVPTSLLAMVDSAVGGKTGVNVDAGKNLVGAFHQPILVWAPIGCLETLPVVERTAGLAEGVKHGVVADEAFFSWCEAHCGELRSGQPAALAELVVQSVRLKAQLVAEDEEERGRRVLLNFGHTVGHALEGALGPGRLRHGHCVALGMVAEARATVAADRLQRQAADRLESLLLELGCPSLAPQVPLARLIDVSRMDKKRAGGKLRAPSLVALGSAEVRLLEPEEVSRWLTFLPLQTRPLEDSC